MASRRGPWWAIPLCLPGGAGLADEGQDRARALYDGGPAASGIVARVGPGGLDVPAGRVPCRGCHARDGRGGREAGVVAPPIHPAALSRPTLKRSSYDPAGFAEAVRDGRSSAGRVMDASMPRYALDEADARALWRFLAAREAEETGGIDAGSVRFGVAAPAGADLPAMMQAAWRERGDPAIHGRHVRFERAEPNQGAAFLATLFDRDGPSSPAPRLFPFASWSDGDPSDEVRGLFADRSKQVEALSGHLPAGARRIAEGGRPDGRERWEDPADVVAVEGPALVLAGPSGWSDLCRRVKPGAHLFAPLHDVEPFIARLLAAGARLTVADPTYHGSGGPSPYPVRLVRTAAAVLEDALVQAGRDLTRGSLMRAFGTIRRDDLPWPALDYRRHPLSGSRTIHITTIDPPR